MKTRTVYTHEVMTFKEFLTFIEPFYWNAKPSFDLRSMSQFSKEFNKMSDKLPDEPDSIEYCLKKAGYRQASKCIQPLHKLYMARTTTIPQDEQ
jgi:hypothetical protein